MFTFESHINVSKQGQFTNTELANNEDLQLYFVSPLWPQHPYLQNILEQEGAGSLKPCSRDPRDEFPGAGMPLLPFFPRQPLLLLQSCFPPLEVHVAAEHGSAAHVASQSWAFAQLEPICESWLSLSHLDASPRGQKRLHRNQEGPWEGKPLLFCLGGSARTL